MWNVAIKSIWGMVYFLEFIQELVWGELGVVVGNRIALECINSDKMLESDKCMTWMRELELLILSDEKGEQCFADSELYV